MTQTILSLTPLALERDSRTLKMAISFARFGYKSIVFEKNRSLQSFKHLGIEVISGEEIERDESPSSTASQNHALSAFKYVLKAIWHSMRKLGLGWLNDGLSYLYFKQQFKKEYEISDSTLPKAEIYFFHSYEYAGLASTLPADVKIVYDAHDFYQDVNPMTDESALVRKWIMPFRWRLEKSLIDQSHSFLTVSPGLRRKYQAVTGKEPDVIMNAHDLRNDSTSTEDIKKYLKLSAQDIVVCCVGNKKRGMIFEELIETFSRDLTHAHLAFIGSGYESFPRSHANIHYIAPRSPNELVPFIRSANLGIIPYFALSENYKFALPNRFFQMVAAELPLVFSNDLVEVASLNNLYHFGVAANIRSRPLLLDTIQKVMKNRDLLRKNIRAAAQKLTWKAEEKKLQSLLEALTYSKQLSDTKIENV